MRSCASFLLLLPALALISSCKKDIESQTGEDTSSSAFPMNTRWTGTLHLGTWRYDQPCYLRINGDKTISLHALLAFIKGNNIETRDSLIGQITRIDSTGGTVSIEADFPDVPILGGHTTLQIKDHRQLSAPSRTGDFITLHLELFPEKDFSIEGPWAGPVMHGGPLEGRHAYPDLSSIIFGAGGTTTYRRNGELAQTKVPQAGEFTLLTVPYKQEGPMIEMDGYNETIDKLVLYFGVLTPDGDKMMVDSRNSIEGRLPSHSATIDWNGPKGVTPVILRQ